MPSSYKQNSQDKSYSQKQLSGLLDKYIFECSWAHFRVLNTEKYQSISFSDAPYRKADRYKEKGKVFFMLSIAKRNS